MENAGSKSADDPKFIFEWDTFYEEGTSKEQTFDNCCKEKFIPLERFTMDILPKQFQNETFSRAIKSRCDRTVKVKLTYISKKCPKTYPDSKDPYLFAKHRGKMMGRYGTGWIRSDVPHLVTDEECPCPECKKDERPMSRYFTVDVTTALHVVFDDTESVTMVCHVFYDSPNINSNEYKMYGLDKGITYWWAENENERCNEDGIEVTCVSHDMDLYDRLNSCLNRDFHHAGILPVIVSHPHGVSKQVGIGTDRTLSITFNKNKNLRKSYILPEDTGVFTEIDVINMYPGFFSHLPGYENIYFTSQPLKLLNLTSDPSKNVVKLSYNRDMRARPFLGYHVHLPKDVKITSMDGWTRFPAEAFSVRDRDLFKAFEIRMESWHLLYDIPTCAGSSGAFVDYLSHLPHYISHAGKTGEGMQRTGVHKEWE